MPQIIPFIAAAAVSYGASRAVQAITQPKKSTPAPVAQQANQAAQTKTTEVNKAKEVAAVQAQESIQQKARRRTKTIFTSPLGLSNTAQYARKTLLGH